MTIYVGSDHGGFALKERVKQWLTAKKFAFEDMGAKKLDPQDDYPQFAFAVAEAVSGNYDETKRWGDRTKGIVLCRSAAGVVIAANKVPGIRAAAVFDVRGTIRAREHDDVNVIGISGDWTDEKTTEAIIQAFLETQFSSEPRHARRVAQISEYESSCCGGGNGGGCC